MGDAVHDSDYAQQQDKRNGERIRVELYRQFTEKSISVESVRPQQ